MYNYYDLLGFAQGRNAPAEEVERKIREQLRIWQKRTSSPDLTARQEAERKVQLLGEARATLLDTERRRTYDQRLAAYRAPEPDSASPAVSSATDLLPQAQRCLASADYLGAIYLARQMRDAGMASAPVWSVLARASAGLGRLDEAVYEARQAVALDYGNPQTHLDLAGIYEERQEWPAAYTAYEAASSLDGRNEPPQFGMAMCLASMGRIPEAISRLERLHAHGTDRETAGLILAQVLIVAAEAVPHLRDGDRYTITSRGEVATMTQMLDRARFLTCDPQVLHDVADVRRYVTWCAQRHFIWGRFTSSLLLRMGGILALAVMCVGCATSSNAAITLAMLGAVTCLAGAIARARVPGWKINFYAELEFQIEARATERW